MSGLTRRREGAKERIKGRREADHGTSTWPRWRLRFLLNKTRTSEEIERLKHANEVNFVPMEAVGENGGLNLSNVRDQENIGSGYTLFFEDDVLVAKITPCFENGKGAIAKNLVNGVGFGTTELYVLDPTPKLDPHFLFYLTISHGFRRAGEASMKGAAGQKRVPDEFVQNFILALPSLELQQPIADYLARETANIDALVTEKERMLSLLEEKRAALISRAVTRGLNPDAPLKPSGLDWLRDIPAHWDLRRLKFISKSLEQGSSPVAANLPAGPDELGILKLSAVSKGRFKREENKALKESEGNEEALSLRKGDVLITRGNTPELVADVACVTSDEPNLLLSDLIYRLRVHTDQVAPEFLTYFLTTRTARVQICRDARGSSGSMVKVSQGHVLDWQIPLPPLSEQIEIVDRIQTGERKSQAMNVQLSISISLLKERRAALITAAVTGQIPVEEMHA